MFISLNLTATRDRVLESIAVQLQDGNTPAERTAAFAKLRSFIDEAEAKVVLATETRPVP